jgi:predicted Zn-dependent protease
LDFVIILKWTSRRFVKLSKMHSPLTLFFEKAFSISVWLTTPCVDNTVLISLLKKVTGTNYANDKFMVITDLDLFVPILTYVFGEAEFNGNFGVVSSHRLHHEYYGLRENEFLLQTRIQKETIHGLGHNFGMIHCSNSKCVMHSSTYVEDIDNKDVLFCDSCKNQNKFV